MEIWERLARLAQEANLDREAGEEETAKKPIPSGPISWVSVGSKKMPILKALLTSACERNCAYCPFRAGRDFRRETFKPHEMAAHIELLTQRDLIRGVLLSSGIAGGSVATQDRLLKTASMLRQHGYTGYIHLKLMPGAEQEQILEAMRLADRVSVNLEAPGEEYLTRLAPQKQFWSELIATLVKVAKIRESIPPQQYGREHWPSLTTQFVVGAAGESDRDLLSWSARLLRETALKRVYYSAFRPISNTPLEANAAERPERIRRLYRAFFLLRDYGFSAEELFPKRATSLPEGDPKEWWAKKHLAQAPVEVNTAPPEMLMRIPGIGPVRAAAIVQARKKVTIHSLGQLQKLGIPVGKAAPFILLNGHRPPYQKALW